MQSRSVVFHKMFSTYGVCINKASLVSGGSSKEFSKVRRGRV